LNSEAKYVQIRLFRAEYFVELRAWTRLSRRALLAAGRFTRGALFMTRPLVTPRPLFVPRALFTP
jgi:hypothetical protein